MYEKRRRRDCYVTSRMGALETRRQKQIFTTFASILACWPEIYQRHLPAIDRTSKQRDFTGGRWHFNDHRSIVRVENGYEVWRLIVGSEEFVSRLQRF